MNKHFTPPVSRCKLLFFAVLLAGMVLVPLMATAEPADSSEPTLTQEQLLEQLRKLPLQERRAILQTLRREMLQEQRPAPGEPRETARRGQIVPQQRPNRQPDATQAPGPKSVEDDCFQCTQVIGYSQVGGRHGGWYVAGGVFESIVGADSWQLLWHGGAGVDRWRNPNYAGWSQPLVSPAATAADRPDRVLLSVSGPYGSDEPVWEEAIEATIDVIRQKIPSARQIILQPVVGGPDGEPCPVPGRAGNGRVRASWQHQHIVNAIQNVVQRRADDPVAIVAGFSPTVLDCDDYRDALGHLTHEGAIAVAKEIGTYYARRDAQCKAAGHPLCQP